MLVRISFGKALKPITRCINHRRAVRVGQSYLHTNTHRDTHTYTHTHTHYHMVQLRGKDSKEVNVDQDNISHSALVVAVVYNMTMQKSVSVSVCIRVYAWVCLVRQRMEICVDWCLWGYTHWRPFEPTQSCEVRTHSASQSNNQTKVNNNSIWQKKGQA